MEHIRTALFDFSRNKGRTFLTSLGIMIGVFSVVLLIAAGLGLKNYIAGEFESLGSNLLYLLPGQVIEEGGGIQDPGGLGARFTESDVEKIERIAGIKYVVPANEKRTRVSAEGETESTRLIPTTELMQDALNLGVEYGAFFTKSDLAKRVKKVVVGSDLAKNLFGSSSQALNKSITIEDKSFKVVGVLKSKGGGMGGQGFDNTAYIPYRISSDFNENKKFYEMIIKVRSEQEIPQIKIKINELLLKKYDEDEFQVIEQTEFLNTITSIFGLINAVLVGIGSISLLVGGIGIMNIMYATVTERIREVGIRRALGATKRNILIQFLVEAVLLSLSGGIVGLILSWISILVIQQFFPAEINLVAVVVALSISSAIGIFFGVFPAKRAADLAPIEAIRYE